MMAPLFAGQELSESDRIELIRGLSSEYATVRDLLPRSKKPLAIEVDGTYNKDFWGEAARQMGPAARVGDLVQVTKVTLDKDKIFLEINGGIKGGGHWYDHVQMSGPVGGTTVPLNGDSNAASGTNLVIMFRRPLVPMRAADVKKILSPILDFDKRSATELYSSELPPEIQKAIKEKRAEKGMDHDQIILALGRPERKIREVVDGAELEDWIFGRPPGKIVFVTFEGNKVVKVKETYAGLGAEAAAPIRTPY
jgi:hypothetical protein